MASLTGLVHWPLPPEALLKATYIGRDLREIEAPAAVLDAALLRKHCDLMLETVKTLQVSFRAHVKTHKTREVTALQVGPAPNTVRLIFSTCAEAELLLPYLLECKEQGREVNIVYGIPPSSTCLSRLQVLRDALGPDSLSFLIDNPGQLRNLHPPQTDDASSTPSPIPIFVKTDTGYHRAGLPPDNPALVTLLEAISQSPHVRLHGFYSHNSLSYATNNPAEALRFLAIELEGCAAAAAVARSKFPAFADLQTTLSVGASPTATSAQNLLLPISESTDATTVEAVGSMRQLIAKLKQQHDVELHAGVYATLDLQQIATHARPLSSDSQPASPTTVLPTMTNSDIAFTILAEVLSIYPDRKDQSADNPTGSKPEVLITAGCLALGREPCKSYTGWGVIAPDPWRTDGVQQIAYDATTVTPGQEPAGTDASKTASGRTGWILDRLSQEHGIVTWEGDAALMAQRPLEVGQKVLIWPNHACIAGALFGWYVVVDSERDMGEPEGVPRGSRIVDVWVRCHGW